MKDPLKKYWAWFIIPEIIFGELLIELFDHTLGILMFFVINFIAYIAYVRFLFRS